MSHLHIGPWEHRPGRTLHRAKAGRQGRCAANAMLGGKLIGSYVFSYSERGISIIAALEMIAPHGVIEVPAFCYHMD